MRTSDAADDGGTAIWTLASLRQNGFGTLGTRDAPIGQGARLPIPELPFQAAVQSPATHEVTHGERVSACAGAEGHHGHEDDKWIHRTSSDCVLPLTPKRNC